jgi:phosphonate transport system substrate-binding protein
MNTFCLAPQLYNRTMHRFLLTISVSLFAWCAQAQVLRFAAIPHEPAAMAQQRFAPLLRHLETRGLTGVYIATPDVNTFVESVVTKRVDFAWMNAFTFVQARARMNGNLSCVAHRREDTQFQVAFVTRDASLKSLDTLAEKTVVFGARTSAVGHLMPRAFLKKESPGTLEKLKAIRHAASHEAVLDQLHRGVADIGVVSVSALAKLRSEGKVRDDPLHIIYTSPPFYDSCFAMPADGDPALFTAVQAALTGLDPFRVEHQAILQATRASRLVAGSDESYALLTEIARELKLIQ